MLRIARWKGGCDMNIDTTEMTHEQMFAGSPIGVGRQYRFDYPDEFTSLDDYSAHRNQSVRVLRPCTENEADVIWDTPDYNNHPEKPPEIVDRMFKVQSDDGWIGDAWESELSEI